MQEFHGLRPEDFQKAWPAAYAQAVAHVMALQQQAAIQLESATEQVLLAQRAAARSARLLTESKHDILDEIRSAHTDAQGQLHELSRVLEHATKGLIAREASFQQAVMREKINIDRIRAEALKAKSALRNWSLWRRLWWALNPSEPC